MHLLQAGHPQRQRIKQLKPPVLQRGRCNQRFVELDSPLQSLQIVALVLTAVGVGLFMVPADYHRIAERHHVSKYFVRMASRMIACGMFPLATGLSIDLYVVVQAAVEKRAIRLSLSIRCFIFYFVLWFIFPWRRP